MEIVFGFLALILSILTPLWISRLVYGSWSEVFKAYYTSEFLLAGHIICSLMLWSTLFITFCAANNTFWHLPYLLK